MLTAIISTRDSERSLVRTLAALVPGVTTGLLREVIVADGGSKDDTAQVADIAGCEFQSSDAPLGERLRNAAASAKGSWLLFLPAGAVPDAAWIAAVEQFLCPGNEAKAAAFAPAAGLGAKLRSLLGRPHAQQGLLIARRRYDALGGHEARNDADVALLRKIGRVTILPVKIVQRDT